MINTDLLTPVNILIIGIVSILFTMLVNVAFNSIYSTSEE